MFSCKLHFLNLVVCKCQQQPNCHQHLSKSRTYTLNYVLHCHSSDRLRQLVLISWKSTNGHWVLAKGGQT